MKIFTLTAREHSFLVELARHQTPATNFRRAQALLWLDEGESVQDITERLRISRQTVYNWITRFQDRQDQALNSRIADAFRSGRPRTAEGVIDPLMDEVIDHDPRTWDYGRTCWTAPLLQHYLLQEHGIPISCESIRLALRRLGIRWKRPRHTLALRSPTWRQSKGG